MTEFGEQKGRKKKKSQHNSQIRGDNLLKNAINHHMRGDIANAERGYRDAIKIGYHNHAIFTNLGIICKNSGRQEEAILLYKKAIETDRSKPDAYQNLGNLYQILGDFQSAVILSSKSLEIEPNNSEALITLGWSHKELGNLNQALASTLKSLELQPDNPNALMNLGGVYKDLERIEDAKTAVSHALSATTKDTNIVTMILDFYDSINEEGLLEEAIIRLKRALPSKSIRITMYEARILFRQKKYEDSWTRLPTLNLASKDLKDWFSISKYHAFRAQIAEKNTQYDVAYYSFEASQIDPLYKSINHRKEHNRIDEYITLSESISKDRVSIDLINQTQSDSHPVFLIGFPRSGTTLLDTVLRSHPAVEVIEEKDPLRLTETLGINNLQKQISNFNSLKEADLNIMRETYNSRLKFHSKDADKLIIDKLPLHTVAIPLINLLFPKAKVIFALRHPCDSILSCFQQAFKPNTTMANFTTLDRSVCYYVKVMNGWTTYNKNLNIDYITSKYEDLLDNFDESVLKILKHLNLNWDDGVRDYRSTAMKRISINTPSSSQVVQPLYKSSVGRWKNYQKYFSKYMVKLNPWIDFFGYSIN